MTSDPLLPSLERHLLDAATQRAGAPARASRRRPYRRLGAVLTAAVASASLAFALSTGSSTDRTAQALRSAGNSDLLGQRFDPFRSVPATGQTPTISSTPAPPDLKDAHRLTNPAADLRITREGDQACLYAKVDPGAYAGTCVLNQQAIGDGLFLQSRPSPSDVRDQHLPAGTTRIAGLIPDGVTSVRFALSDGSEQTALVTDNSVYATADHAPRTASYTEPNGANHLVHFGTD